MEPSPEFGREREKSSSGEEQNWSSDKKPVESFSINEEKKMEALSACHFEHVEFVKCMKAGFFANCSSSHKAFWDCYAHHRGVRGNKFMAWLGLPEVRIKEDKKDDKQSDTS